VDLARRKERLRVELESQRRAVPATHAEAAERALAAQIAGLPGFDSCRRLVLYAAVRGELSMEGIAQLAGMRGLPVLWPRVSGERLEFVTAAASELAPGAFGVPEPPAGRTAVPLAAGDWVVIPGVAFDRAGRRLGRGGGFYDRALAGCAESVRIGVGYDFQCVDEVPAGPLDQRMDWVVTNARVLAARRGVREAP
jgi:5-formyltetrahydrofolate cyclo-ligase